MERKEVETKIWGNNWEWNSNPPAQIASHYVQIHAPQGLCAVDDIKSLSAIILVNCPCTDVQW